MASKNLVILLGNLGRDPEVHYTPSGRPITTISLATSETWKDRESGERQERTEWHRVVFFDRLAEVVAEYLAKGSQIDVQGKLRTRKWTDKDGADRYTTEVVGKELLMLGGKRQEGAPEGPVHNGTGEDTEPDDDIPF